LGKKCGRRERGIDARDSGKEQSELERSSRFATVEGIPVRGMALTFAGQRWNVDLGSVRRRERVSSPLGERTGDNGCPEEAEEGNDVRTHSSKCMHRARERGNAALSFRQYDASFAWSSDPCTSIATATSSEQSAEVARTNRYRGRANLVKARKNRHRGRCERTMRSSPLVTASARERAWQVRKGRASRRSSQRGL
jgi:hypothetical protein